MNDTEPPRPEYLTTENFPRGPRDQYCGAYVVWHTLRHFGQPTPLSDVLGRMHVNPRSGVSLATVAATLQTYGLRVRAVRLTSADLTSLTDVFLPYLTGPDGATTGHVGLCVPLGDARCLVFDGADPPQELLAGELLSSAGIVKWDGVAIVITQDVLGGIYPEAIAATLVLLTVSALARTRLKRNRTSMPVAVSHTPQEVQRRDSIDPRQYSSICTGDDVFSQR